MLGCGMCAFVVVLICFGGYVLFSFERVGVTVCFVGVERGIWGFCGVVMVGFGV